MVFQLADVYQTEVLRKVLTVVARRPFTSAMGSTWNSGRKTASCFDPNHERISVGPAWAFLPRLH